MLDNERQHPSHIHHPSQQFHLRHGSEATLDQPNFGWPASWWWTPEQAKPWSGQTQQKLSSWPIYSGGCSKILRLGKVIIDTIESGRSKIWTQVLAFPCVSKTSYVSIVQLVISLYSEFSFPASLPQVLSMGKNSLCLHSPSSWGHCIWIWRLLQDCLVLFCFA